MTEFVPSFALPSTAATQVIAKLLKEMYPQNPDIVLGREARRIVERLEHDGWSIVKLECRGEYVTRTRPPTDEDREFWTHPQLGSDRMNAADAAAMTEVTEHSLSMSTDLGGDPLYVVVEGAAAGADREERESDG